MYTCYCHCHTQVKERDCGNERHTNDVNGTIQDNDLISNLSKITTSLVA